MAKAVIILELSGIEASVLLKVLSHVGGKPCGPRGTIDSIIKVMKELSIEPVGDAEGFIRLD